MGVLDLVKKIWVLIVVFFSYTAQLQATKPKVLSDKERASLSSRNSNSIKIIPSFTRVFKTLACVSFFLVPHMVSAFENSCFSVNTYFHPDRALRMQVSEMVVCAQGAQQDWGEEGTFLRDDDDESISDVSYEEDEEVHISQKEKDGSGEDEVESFQDIGVEEIEFEERLSNRVELGEERNPRLRGTSKKRQLNVIGPDDRVPVEDFSFPVSSIGKVRMTDQGGKNSYCTGTLVSSKHVLTNGHCVTQKDLQVEINEIILDSLTFTPASKKGERYPSYSVKKVFLPRKYFDGGFGEEEQDWALLELSHDAGNEFGWMGVSNLGYQDYENKEVNLLGFSGDHYREHLGGDFHCQVDGTVYYWFGLQVIHDCDSSPGSSGSAIYYLEKNQTDHVSPVIYALHHAHIILPDGATQADEFSPYTANLAVATKEVAETLKALGQQLKPKKPSRPPGGLGYQYDQWVVVSVGAAGCVLVCYMLKPKANKSDKKEAPKEAKNDTPSDHYISMDHLEMKSKDETH